MSAVLDIHIIYSGHNYCWMLASIAGASYMPHLVGFVGGNV